MDADPNDAIRGLVEAWCERRHYGALALVLPAWTGNDGLTDGWANLHDALKHAHAVCVDLPPEERGTLKRAYVAIERALQYGR